MYLSDTFYSVDNAMSCHICRFDFHYCWVVRGYHRDIKNKLVCISLIKEKIKKIVLF